MVKEEEEKTLLIPVPDFMIFDLSGKASRLARHIETDLSFKQSNFLKGFKHIL